MQTQLDVTLKDLNKSCEEEVVILKFEKQSMGQWNKGIGLDGAAQVIFNDLTRPAFENLFDPHLVEIKRYCPLTWQSCTQEIDATLEELSNSPAAANIQKELSPEEMEIEIASDKVGAEGQISIDHHISIVPWIHTKIEEWVVEDVQPIQPNEARLLHKDKETTTWVRQNLIKLGKLFGIDFQGHEEETLELLMQIDSCRQARKMENESITKD